LGPQHSTGEQAPLALAPAAWSSYSKRAQQTGHAHRERHGACLAGVSTRAKGTARSGTLHRKQAQAAIVGGKVGHQQQLAWRWACRQAVTLDLEGARIEKSGAASISARTQGA